MTPQDAQALICKIADELAEKGFDAVQIVASRIEDDGGTRAFQGGAGNWYARRGLCEQFIERDQADTSARILGSALNPPDEGDSWKSEEPD